MPVDLVEIRVLQQVIMEAVKAGKRESGKARKVEWC